MPGPQLMHIDGCVPVEIGAGSRPCMIDRKRLSGQSRRQHWEEQRATASVSVLASMPPGAGWRPPSPEFRPARCRADRSGPGLAISSELLSPHRSHTRFSIDWCEGPPLSAAGCRARGPHMKKRCRFAMPLRCKLRSRSIRARGRRTSPLLLRPTPASAGRAYVNSNQVSRGAGRLKRQNQNGSN